ncbi:MAG: GIY-YIG nuclease family protein [Luteolibacter sp.]
MAEDLGEGGLALMERDLIALPASVPPDSPMGETVWSVYMLRCGDGSLYTGIATDVERRFSEHESQGPKGAKYLRGRLPLQIVFRKEIGTRSEASKEELRVKALSRTAKLALITG